MTSRSMLLLLLAGGIAFGTAMMVRNHISTNSANAALPTDVTRVLVASSDIAPGSFVRVDKHLQWTAWPNENLNPSFLIEGKADVSSYNGSVVRRQILKGEPVTDGVLVQADEGGFMAAVLTAGMRAISIAVDSTTGNAGFIFPGDKVDLILTHSIEIDSVSGERGDAILASETFIEDVRVLAVDQQLDNPENTAILAKTVTLEVSKEQAEKINVAKDLGKISLSLRSLAMEREGETLMAGETINLPVRHATRDSDVSSMLTTRTHDTVRKVVVIRGADREEIEFGN